MGVGIGIKNKGERHQQKGIRGNQCTGQMFGPVEDIYGLSKMKKKDRNKVLGRAQELLRLLERTKK